MAIKNSLCAKTNKVEYEVHVNLKSKIVKNLRVQKRRTRIKSKVQAEKIQKELYEVCFSKMKDEEGKGFLWSHIVEKWYEFKKHDEFDPISELTLLDYLSALTTWTANFWNKSAKDISRSDIKKVIKHMNDSGRSKSFQSKTKGLITRVFNWAIEEGLIPGLSQSPTWGINISRKYERVPTILNKEEIIKLVFEAKKQNHPWYHIWVVALLTGCRNGELYAMTWDDVDFTNKSIRISKSYNKRLRLTKSTKAGYWRNVPINTDLESVLSKLKENSPNQFVLPRIRDWAHGYQAKVLKIFCSSIGITPIRFHDLRACFATQLLQNKVPSTTVMKVCGWRDLDTMGRYIRLSGIDEQGATDSLKVIPGITLKILKLGQKKH